MRRIVLWFILGAVGRAAAQAPLPTLKLVRDLRIDGEVAGLSEVRDIVVSRSGVLAASQWQDHLIRFFDHTGRALGVFGRAGEGPGEFRQLGGMTWWGDTLVVADDQLNRFTVVSPTRKLLRTVAFPVSVRDPVSRTTLHVGVGMRPRAAYPDGGLLLIGPVLNPPSAAWGIGARGPRFFLRLRRDGTLERVIGRYPTFGMECFTSDQHSIPFCPYALRASAAAGSVVAVLSPPTTGKGGPEFRITVIGERGDTIMNHSFAYVAERIPAGVRDSARKAAVMPGAQMSSTVRTMGIPTVYPPVQRMELADDGTVWLRRWTSRVDQVWQIVDRTAAMAGQVIVPKNVKVLLVEHDGFYGVETNGDGGESIVHYMAGRVAQR